MKIDAKIADRVLKAITLHEDESRRDPESEPYRSKYAARELFEEIKSNLTKIIDGQDELPDDEIKLYKSQLAGTLYFLGVIAVDTEEFSTGEEHLSKAIAIIKGHEAESNNIIVAISTYNHLGILWSHRGEFEKAKDFLEEANGFYEEYKTQSNASPKTIPYLFLGEVQNEEEEEQRNAENNKAFEKQHTLTFYYLAQVHGHLDDAEKSAHFCHATLQRQLESKEYDHLEWAVNAATLAQFFINKEKFRLGRHLLASSSRVLSNYENEMIAAQSDCEENTERLEKFKMKKADNARCWGKYALSLLQASKDSFENEPDQTRQDESSAEQEEDDMKKLEFSQLEVADLESEVGCVLVSEFEEARPIFLCGLRWLTVAKEFYTLEDHTSDHVAVTQDMSHLYKHLAFFEICEDRRCKMHKRRIDLLSPLLKELNPRFYLCVCRQLDYELAETYSAMVDNKFTLAEKTGPNPTAHQIKKINSLAMLSIKHFLQYLDSMKDLSTGQQPSVYSEECVRAVMVAWFHLGRLWSKIITNDPKTVKENMAKSLENYKCLVDYCDAHPECVPLMTQELAVCREMVELLPFKMQLLRCQ
ncbi:KIF-binding protein [Oratosquilla oratoria]|uniref:KIF-binding protein n=1 Tax=Oratosquilla oratoria TaxID=337810 RepID=UPI003F766F2C